MKVLYGTPKGITGGNPPLSATTSLTPLLDASPQSWGILSLLIPEVSSWYRPVCPV